MQSLFHGDRIERNGVIARNIDEILPVESHQSVKISIGKRDAERFKELAKSGKINRFGIHHHTVHIQDQRIRESGQKLVSFCMKIVIDLFRQRHWDALHRFQLFQGCRLDLFQGTKWRNNTSRRAGPRP
jgi:hypothetical protein